MCLNFVLKVCMPYLFRYYDDDVGFALSYYFELLRCGELFKDFFNYSISLKFYDSSELFSSSKELLNLLRGKLVLKG